MIQNIRKYGFGIFFAAMLTGALPAKAQKDIKFSNTEDIAVAFYKTGSVIPNFRNWVTARKPYNLTPLARRPKVMEEELTRLNVAYQSFDPKNDLLTIRTSAHLTPKITRNTAGEEIYSLEINLDQKADVFYLPYEFMGQSIMILPYKFQSVRTDIISKSEYNRIQSLPNSQKRHPLIMRIRAKEADLKHPYDVDGIAQWAFKVDIASLESWTPKGELIWEYSAPWYLSPNQAKIQTLFDERPEASLNKGHMKAFPDNN